MLMSRTLRTQNKLFKVFNYYFINKKIFLVELFFHFFVFYTLHFTLRNF